MLTTKEVRALRRMIKLANLLDKDHPDKGRMIQTAETLRRLLDKDQVHRNKEADFRWVPVAVVREEGAPSVVIDLDEGEDRECVWRWGGQTLTVVRVIQNGKYAHAWLSARVSGDSRAGDQRGVHFRLTTQRGTRESHVERHCLTTYVELPSQRKERP